MLNTKVNKKERKERFHEKQKQRRRIVESNLAALHYNVSNLGRIKDGQSNKLSLLQLTSFFEQSLLDKIGEKSVRPLFKDLEKRVLKEATGS